MNPSRISSFDGLQVRFFVPPLFEHNLTVIDGNNLGINNNAAVI
jgi:hypothetical protein